GRKREPGVVAGGDGRRRTPVGCAQGGEFHCLSLRDFGCVDFFTIVTYAQRSTAEMICTEAFQKFLQLPQPRRNSMSHTTINPESLPKPSGFAHGILAGNTVFLGGQTALDKNMNIVPGGIVEQFTQAFSNVLTTLREAGGQPEDLVNVTIYLTDVDDYMANGREIGRLWREMAGT